MDRLYSPLSCLLLLSIQFVFNNSYNIDRIVYNVCMIMTTLNDNVCMEYECKDDGIVPDELCIVISC